MSDWLHVIVNADVRTALFLYVSICLCVFHNIIYTNLIGLQLSIFKINSASHYFLQCCCSKNWKVIVLKSRPEFLVYSVLSWKSFSQIRTLAKSSHTRHCDINDSKRSMTAHQTNYKKVHLICQQCTVITKVGLEQWQYTCR